MATPLAATRKPYATPLGAAPADDELLARLEAIYPGDLYADELSHRTEHSLEFQALYLRYLGLVGPERATIVPLLCGSLHQWVPGNVSPTTVPAVAEALAALREVLAGCQRRVCLVGGADLAHIGPQFGDPGPLDRTQLDLVGRRDAEMLEIICQGDADGFYQQVMSDADARRICGLSPIYYLLSLLGLVSGELLKYSQWVDPRGQGSVTYAGVLFKEALS
jgi:MEMO1 family protein